MKIVICNLSKLKYLILITLLAVYLASCSSKTPQESSAAAFDEVETTVKAVVKDTERAGKLLAVIHQLEKDLLQQRKELEQQKTAIYAMNADYNASRTDMERAYDTYEEKLSLFAETLIKADQDMKALATAEEWAEISSKKHRLGGY